MDKKQTKNILLIITYTLLLTFILFQHTKVVLIGKYIISVIFPFIVGGCIAFILSVPLNCIERKLFSKVKSKFMLKAKRPLSILITLVAVVGVIGVVLFLVIPEIGRTIAILIDSLSVFPEKVLKFLDEKNIDMPMLEKYIKEIDIDWAGVIKNMVNFAKNGIGSVFSSTFGFITSVISKVTSGFIGFVFAIYVLSQKEKLASQGKRVLYVLFKENVASKIISVLQRTRDTFASFITGQCIEAVILGTMFFVTLSIIRFNYALLIGVLIAVTALVPIFGAFVGCAVGTFLLLVEDPVQALWFLVIFQVLQQIEGNLIYPHVVGGSIGLPSIWVLVAVTVGGNLFGIAGMLFFIPLSSVLYSFFREFVSGREKAKSEALIKEKVSDVTPGDEPLEESDTK